MFQAGAHGLATEPVEITNHATIEKVAYYIGKRANTGEPIKLMPTPGLKKIASMDKGEYAIPDDMVFLPLRGKQTKVSEKAYLLDDLEAEKVAMQINTVHVLSDGTSYTLRGRNAEISGFDQVMSERETEFALGALGVPGETIPGIMKKASDESVKIPGTRRVIPEEVAQAAMIKKAAALVPNIDHMRCDLIKEAALLCMPKAHVLYKQASVVIDRENLDAVLALNFITPENVASFIDALPTLEKTANRLAEIVIASRMGMDEVRESAASRAMSSLSDVIEGLIELRGKVN